MEKLTLDAADPAGRGAAKFYQRSIRKQPRALASKPRQHQLARADEVFD
jgi:hypothetical protein